MKVFCEWWPGLKTDADIMLTNFISEIKTSFYENLMCQKL